MNVSWLYTVVLLCMPLTIIVWAKAIFKITYFVLIQAWNDMRNFPFSVNFPFKHFSLNKLKHFNN